MIDTLLRGVASGGVRMHPGCTESDVADLARLMTLKEALAHRPGMSTNRSAAPRAASPTTPATLRPGACSSATSRPCARCSRTYGRQARTSGFGLRQADIDRAVRALGLRSSIDAALPHVLDGAEAGLARLMRAFAAHVDGVGLGDLVGGYGVCESVLATLRHRGEDGRVDRNQLGPHDRALPRGGWLDTDCDVLVTAAVSYAIDATSAHRVRARYLVEAANASLVPAAEQALRERGVLVVPDFVANSAANSWWWTLFGDIEPTPHAAFHRIRTTMRELCAQMLTTADRNGQGPREGATAMARRNLALMTNRIPPPAQAV
ncbi:Glu/Leu/Phe/Val dehydrogenase dimerization domain-containing protein [Streptomyces sp. UNOB3_S3]|uniref:Glu/Leu/Phe/Val dehydrogenase dimerization domain-containing protein n=1 Tax=Streptomyces sp. UNOB3_S3 TaxID=2871682 RepID=UPI001E2E25DB|nr:Glu/Leu/Phe/Val dehydrogenase dimerization domain-containing protein [Streptomyces sp. UNOB3_S3]